MRSIAGVPLNTISLAGGSALFQLIAVSFLPASRGMTLLAPTTIVIIAYVIGIYLMSRLFLVGLGLALVGPLMTLLIIGGSIGVGILFYGEHPSPTKLLMIGGAVGLLVSSSQF